MKFVFFTALGLVSLFNGAVQGLPRDNIPPAIRCPDSMVVNSRQSSTIVCWPFPKATDESGNPSVTCSHKAGLQLQTPSTTIIKCEAKDAAGNKASCSFRIDVKDIAPPKIICPADQEINTGSSSTFRINWNDPKVTDNSNMPPTVRPSYQRGSLVHSPGVYTISYQAIDASANQATCSFTIKLTVPDCKVKIPPPVNGAVACWNYQGSNVCTVSCNNNFDFSFKPSRIYVCSRGTWRTFSILGGSNSVQWPDCSVKSSGMKKMPVQFYYTGDSQDPNVIALIKQNGLAVLRSPFSPPFFCTMHPNCNVQNIQVHTGKKSTA